MMKNLMFVFFKPTLFRIEQLMGINKYLVYVNFHRFTSYAGILLTVVLFIENKLMYSSFLESVRQKKRKKFLPFL